MTAQVTGKTKIYSTIGWLIDHAYLFLGLTVFEFFSTTTLLYLFVKKSFWRCLLESLSVLMGDSPSLLALDALSDLPTKITFISLLLLRFSGWLILPLVIGMVIAATEKKIEEQQRQLFLDEIQLLRGQERLDEYSRNELLKLGIPQEKAYEIIKNNRERFWEYHKELVETKYGVNKIS